MTKLYLHFKTLQLNEILLIPLSSFCYCFIFFSRFRLNFFQRTPEFVLFYSEERMWNLGFFFSQLNQFLDESIFPSFFWWCFLRRLLRLHLFSTQKLVNLVNQNRIRRDSSLFVLLCLFLIITLKSNTHHGLSLGLAILEQSITEQDIM